MHVLKAMIEKPRTLRSKYSIVLNYKSANRVKYESQHAKVFFSANDVMLKVIVEADSYGNERLIRK